MQMVHELICHRKLTISLSSSHCQQTCVLTKCTSGALKCGGGGRAAVHETPATLPSCALPRWSPRSRAPSTGTACSAARAPPERSSRLTTAAVAQLEPWSAAALTGAVAAAPAPACIAAPVAVVADDSRCCPAADAAADGAAGRGPAAEAAVLHTVQIAAAMRRPPSAAAAVAAAAAALLLRVAGAGARAPVLSLLWLPLHWRQGQVSRPMEHQQRCQTAAGGAALAAAAAAPLRWLQPPAARA